jgi:hypothetical protein
LEELAAGGLEECRRLEATLDGREELAPVLQRLDRIDTAILEVASRRVAGFLLHPLIQELAQYGEPDPGRPAGQAARALESSRRLYRELHESAVYHRRILELRLAAWQPAGPGRQAKGLSRSDRS